MPMFSPEMGALIANLGARRGARQEANADARARQVLLSSIQDPLYAQVQAEAQPPVQQAAAPMLTENQFEFTPDPAAPVVPMLAGLQPIVPDPGSASQGRSSSQGGVSGAGRNQAEAILFPMLTKAENRDLSRKTKELDELVRARPGLVSRMYAGEDGAKPIDDRIKALQTEIEKGQASNERLQNNQMLTGQRLVSSYSNRESQQASLAARKEMAAAREATRSAIATGRLEFDNKKLLVNSNLKGLDTLVRLYGINSAYLASPAALQRAVMSGTLAQELIQKGADANTVGRALGGIRRGTLLVQSNDPKDIQEGATVLMDANMDLDFLLGMEPDPQANENLAKVNASLPSWAPKFDALSEKEVEDIILARKKLREENNTPLGALQPGEAPPEFVFSNGTKYVRASESTSSTRPSKIDKPNAPPKVTAPKKGWYKDPDGVMRKH